MPFFLSQTIPHPQRMKQQQQQTSLITSIFLFLSSIFETIIFYFVHRPTLKFKEWPASNLEPDVQIGDYVRRWDFRFIWTEHCHKGITLEPLRQKSDELADAVVRIVNIQQGQDSLDAVQGYRESVNVTDVDVEAFWSQVNTIPDWVDWARIERGQEVFWDYSSYIILSLLHFSLAGGFASPKVVSVLSCTGYLAPSSKSYIRLFETMQMILDCMNPNSLQPGTGQGWRSILRVRLLHSQVRTRIARLHSKYYDGVLNGIAINQEDLISTLCSFSVAMFWSLERMGMPMKEEDKRSYIALWRYIGYLMGVDPIIDPLRSLESAEGWAFSVVMHLLQPDPTSCVFAQSVLNSLTDRPPAMYPAAYHHQMARLVLGQKLGDALELDGSNITYWWRVRIQLVLLRITRLMVSALKWRELRIKWAKKLIPEMVERVLGGKTSFEMKFVPGSGETLKTK